MGFFSHRDPDGVYPEERARAAGYVGAIYENLAWGPPNAQAVVDLWIESDAHCVVLADGGGRSLGVGHAVGPNGRQYWVMLLGK